MGLGHWGDPWDRNAPWDPAWDEGFNVALLSVCVSCARGMGQAEMLDWQQPRQ